MNHHHDPAAIAPLIRGHTDLIVPRPAPPAKAKKNPWLVVVELAASAITLAGMYIGSTTLVGALCYLVSLPLWYTMAISARQWGLLPLHVASTAVVAINIYRALGAAGG